jgi:hypothetical protein
MPKLLVVPMPSRSSATRSSSPADVWGVNFGSGLVGYDSKAFSDDYVRAVRGGS